MERTMTVRELYEALGAQLDLYGDLPIFSEGCDCSGSINDIEVTIGFGYSWVELLRKSSEERFAEAAERERRAKETEKGQWQNVESVKHLLPEGHQGPDGI